MELVKLDLMSKNNRQRGVYLYVPIVCIDSDYYRCMPIRSKTILKKSQVKELDLLPASIIEPQFYDANRLVNLKYSV